MKELISKDTYGVFADNHDTASVDERALDLMEEESPNCYSCRYRSDGFCGKFKTEQEANEECVNGICSFAFWEGDIDYFRGIIINEGYTSTY